MAIGLFHRVKIHLQVFLVLILAAGCQTFREQPVLSAPETAPPAMALLDTSLYQQMRLASERSVRHFYVLRDHSFFWSDGRRLSPEADTLRDVLARIHLSGLIPEEYHLQEIQMLAMDPLSGDRLALLDVLLTDGYLTLHSHIRDGRLDPSTLRRRDYAQRVDEKAIASLQGVRSVSMREELILMEPKARPYEELKNALAALRPSVADATRNESAVRISLNMERWRWQKQWPDRYVFVNIPAFLMRVVEGDSVWLESKVIVGKRETPTPVMESIIRSFIIYPYWHVPYSIATREILPALQNSSAYLQRNNFEVLNKRGDVILPDTIQWDLYNRDNFPFVLRQREGSENSMGIIKFNFANDYGVYLHDTNSKRLFQRSKRDLSHGCVRVNQAVAFAHYLVREDDIYVSPEDLDQYLSLQQRLKIDLRKPLTLKLEYFTAEVKNGNPVFYDDIYKKDSAMIASLYHPAYGVIVPSDSTAF